MSGEHDRIVETMADQAREGLAADDRERELLLDELAIRAAVRNDPEVAALYHGLVASVRQLRVTPAELRAMATLAAVDVERMAARPQYPPAPGAD